LRVNQVLREVIANELERLADVDERLRLVTVTAVETSPDFRSAVVYMSSLSEEADAGLQDQRIRLQRLIGREVRLKHTPHLDFVADPAVASGLRVEEILHHISRNEPTDPTADGDR
jgi:ribosome-binding factor A